MQRHSTFIPPTSFWIVWCFMSLILRELTNITPVSSTNTNLHIYVSHNESKVLLVSWLEMILIILGWSWQFYTTDSPTSTFGYSTSCDARSKKYDIQSNRIPHVVLQLIQCSYSNQWIESLYWLINCNYYLVIQISLWASLYSMSVTCLIRSWCSPLSSYCPRDIQESMLT
jgi:hypothetical protein